jgi:DNA repair protein RadA/Sms
MTEQFQAAQPAWAGAREQANVLARKQPETDDAPLRACPVTSISEDDGLGEDRMQAGIAAADRVLGGGLVRGSLVLLGGDPGIGKSTLLLQLLAGLCQRPDPLIPPRPPSPDKEPPPPPKVLYVSGEESLTQTASRARRLGARVPGLHLLAETRLSAILHEAARMRPQVLAIDSIQMVVVDDIESVPGSLPQVREATARLLPFAKNSGIATLLVGHVTKEGALAGPKTLEHMVDTVLLFEGERGHPYRILRASKNRFGPTSEIGVFEMQGVGLREVPDPSAWLLAERPVGVPGSVITAALEGSLPLVLEVQALCAGAAGVPRRNAIGIDPYRVAMLLAVIERHAGIDILGLDVFVNVAGGLRLSETAADLAVAMALCSSATGRVVDPQTACFGEVGLSGEVRSVSQAETRLREVGKLGFRRCLVPAATARALKKDREKYNLPPDLEILGVRDVAEAATAALGPRRSPVFAPGEGGR